MKLSFRKNDNSTVSSETEISSEETHPEILENKILSLCQIYQERMEGVLPEVFNKNYWQGRLVEWVIQDPNVKVDLFHFIDVLPSLQSNEQVAQHIKEYLLKNNRELPTLLSTALKTTLVGITSNMATRTLRKNVTDMGARFIIGETPETAIPALKKMFNKDLGFTVDLLGEATLSEVEADTYRAQYSALIDKLTAEASQWPENELLEKNHQGAIPRVNVSLKLSAMSSFVDPVDPVGSVHRLKKRILPLLLHAREKGAFINFDMEQWALHGITMDLFEEMVMHKELRDWPHLGIVVQGYLKESYRHVDRLLSLAKSRDTPLTVRLVKGAYWDYEVVHARQNGFDCPVWLTKPETDFHYEQLSSKLLDEAEYLHSAFGSHNLRSLFHAIIQANERQLPKNAYEIQMLYGMAETERKVLKSMGHRVRVYTPIGALLPGMAYLVRRLLENTSNSGFLRLRHFEGKELTTLLLPPNPKSLEDQEPELLMVSGNLQSPFQNAPQLDFSRPIVHEAYSQTLQNLPGSFPVQVPVVINGEETLCENHLTQYCPGTPEIQVASVSQTSLEQAEQAVESARKVWPEWRDKALEERALLLDKLADLLEEDRMSLAALMSFEVGKPWNEAQADVAEAIDFCRYYARQSIIELGTRNQGNVEGEDNLLFYEGRGPTVVIAPWNFPVAILCGMTTAALVSGNPVIMKPAEQSSAVAFRLFQKMIECGFPREVVQFLPGRGEVVGEFLVKHPDICQIAFTGSKEVGLAIHQQAGITQMGQIQVKKIVCEMGGKNAIVVDDDADLDAAIIGIMQSAFGFAGQKCSSCSRVFLVGDTFDSMVPRLVEACRSLKVGPAHDPSCQLGPVIDRTTFERLENAISHFEKDESVRLIYKGKHSMDGFYVGPVLFEVEDPNHPLMQEELFGPVLALSRVETFEEALDKALTTDFALTGSVYSRLPSHLEMAAQKFRVGNLYLNRGSTGALVDRQPFGGFKMSGMGTKAGGPGYLLNFADPRCVTENTMRHGFTPDFQL